MHLHLSHVMFPFRSAYFEKARGFLSNSSTLYSANDESSKISSGKNELNISWLLARSGGSGDFGERTRLRIITFKSVDVEPAGYLVRAVCAACVGSSTICFGGRI